MRAPAVDDGQPVRAQVFRGEVDERVKAGQLATAILDVGERIEHANSLDALEALQDELEEILRGAVVGLRDGTISTDGLDTFKLGYQFVRDEIGLRRAHLKRHAGHEDNVVIVKTAQSA